MSPHERARLFWRRQAAKGQIRESELVEQLATEFQVQSNADLERHRDRRALVQMHLDAALTRERRLVEMLQTAVVELMNLHGLHLINGKHIDVSNVVKSINENTRIAALQGDPRP